MDLPAVVDGLRDGGYRRAALPEGFDHGEPARVFDDGAGQITVGLRLDRCVDAAVVRDEQHEQKGCCRGSQRDERRDRTADRKADENDQKVQISAHKVIDHADAHVLERGKAGRDGGKNAAGADLLEIAERDALERVADGQPVARGQLIADRFLQSRPEVIEQEAKKNKNDLKHDAFPDERRVKCRSGALRVDQMPDGIGGQRQQAPPDHTGRRRTSIHEQAHEPVHAVKRCKPQHDAQDG